MHKFLTRKLYLDKLINSLNNTKIKLITGYKSVGKSTILKQLADYIEKNIDNSNLIYIDDFYIKKFKTYQKVKDYIFAKHKVDKVNYLLIDDIQVCPDFKQLINDMRLLEFCVNSIPFFNIKKLTLHKILNSLIGSLKWLFYFLFKAKSFKKSLNIKIQKYGKV